ncbi:hypothetical protein VTH06DRAFT_7064 [Thermothelomyces fergusii]
MDSPRPDSAAAPSRALLECLLCSLRFDTPEAKRRHAKSDWHVYKIRCRVAEPGTTIPPPDAAEPLFSSSSSSSSPRRRGRRPGRPWPSSSSSDEEQGSEEDDSGRDTPPPPASAEQATGGFVPERGPVRTRAGGGFDADLQTTTTTTTTTTDGRRAARPDDDDTLRLPSGKLLARRSPPPHHPHHHHHHQRVDPSSPRTRQRDATGAGGTTGRPPAQEGGFGRVRGSDQTSLAGVAPARQRSVLLACRRAVDEAGRAERRGRRRLDGVGNKTAVRARYYKQEVPIYLGG